MLLYKLAEILILFIEHLADVLLATFRLFLGRNYFLFLFRGIGVI